ncbi:hypothetical protein NA57DRAFT_51981 [Rhizodiscina lignyota]|uniref:Uncharacterized protein n=1 Tax=Rhizodiscina lignyota TaxID=1504668 RepID=A0A9P4M9R0_9PEZI|nr:hypothetical protein NA57DRAFT_51981 [Rhizodiscina lignyota]
MTRSKTPSQSSRRSSDTLIGSSRSSSADTVVASRAGTPAEEAYGNSVIPPVPPIPAEYLQHQHASQAAAPTTPTPTDPEPRRGRRRRRRRPQDSAPPTQAGPATLNRQISEVQPEQVIHRLCDWPDPQELRETGGRVYSRSGREVSIDEYENHPDRVLSIRERVAKIKANIAVGLADLKKKEETKENANKEAFEDAWGVEMFEGLLEEEQ